MLWISVWLPELSPPRRNITTDSFLVQWERLEMCSMSKASEITNNVWQGPTPDPAAIDEEENRFDIYIEASDIANIPGPRYLKTIGARSEDGPQRLEFPSSGSVMPPSWSQNDIRDFVETCRWIYNLANPEGSDQSVDADGDTQMTSHKTKPRKILIHCGDGYTESSLLVVAYFMFAEGVPVHEAWLRLHCDKKRNFFAYSSDVNFLMGVQQRILQESPATRGRDITRLPDPAWLSRMDGSLPSRILPYMYLGNLPHANNPELLQALGIKRILSVGEPVSWNPTTLEQWGEDNLLLIDQVQDNGIDPLTGEFDRCLEFIGTSNETTPFPPSHIISISKSMYMELTFVFGSTERGKTDGTATLVHCRVGVSRSATICIAEVMAFLGLSFPRA